MYFLSTQTDLYAFGEDKTLIDPLNGNISSYSISKPVAPICLNNGSNYNENIVLTPSKQKTLRQ